jgi:hypothetical protein
MNWKLPYIFVVLYYATQGYRVASCAWDLTGGAMIAAIIFSVSLDNSMLKGEYYVNRSSCLSDTF